jgi:hypothetical protein
MAKSMMRLWSPFLLTILLIVAADRVDAAIITVTFSGTASGTSAGTFQGFFVYDTSQPQASSNTFNLTGSPTTHVVRYTTTNPSRTQTGINATCDPFTITTSNNTFTLVARLSGPTTVRIVIPTVPMSATSLPGCSVFPRTPTNSTFTLSGGFSFTGTITALGCGHNP